VMPQPLWDFYALHDINLGGVGAVRVAAAGDGLMRDTVDNLRDAYGITLEMGVDIEAARPDLWTRPADNATRDEWAEYALSQGMTPAQLDDMKRSDIVARFPADEPTEPLVPVTPTALDSDAPPATEDNDEVPGSTVEEVLAWVNEDPDRQHARAVMAYRVEQERERPRTGVVDPLRKLLGDEE
jgi:hypothetical protein